MIARIRKAIVAGVTAGIGAAVTVLAKSGWHLDSTTVSQAVAAFAGAGVIAGYATWATRNAPAVGQ